MDERHCIESGEIVVILISATFAFLSGYIYFTKIADQRLRSAVGVKFNATEQAVREFSNKTLMIIGSFGGALIGWTFGGTLGAFLGAGGAWWVVREWNNREQRFDRQRIEQSSRDVPIMIDLLGAALASGATVRDSIVVVREALDESPLADVLGHVISMVDLGADAREAWKPWVDDPALGRLAQAITRTQDSGAALVQVLDETSLELRRMHQRTVQIAARSAGVKAVIPLAACFLPAFFLLGVVPIVASLFDSFNFLSTG